MGLYGFCSGAICQFVLPLNASHTMTVVAMVDSEALTGSVTNVAAVYSVDANDATTATVETTISTAASLHISKVAGRIDPAYAGGTALYQIVVSNDGPSDAQNVVLTDTLPLSTTYVGGDASCTASGSEIVCTVGALAVEQAATCSSRPMWTASPQMDKPD